ncbi:MAG: phage integrase N-terminal SAM-like domain-containing protein [Desulfuromonadaceae bacterium]|nr:phage integrase N-terminal SAM-like domain-containing protein [Desulfuromonadaceae bacterium]MDD4128897.1 phage integrase N-terminal SAM-like domain-containing protein [Desulfuromonadaceae bacterium]
MIPVPYSVMNDYVTLLRIREIPPAHVENYKKWLRYFYDFYAKYLDTDDKSEKIKLFLEKLRSKKQTLAQCQQAAHAISLYFEMQGMERQPEKTSDEPNSNPLQIAELETGPQVFNENFAPTALFTSFKPRQSQYLVAGYQDKSCSPEWDELIDKLADEIKVRHYSRKTLKTYAQWSRQFQRFLKNKSPQEQSTADVKEYSV